MARPGGGRFVALNNVGFVARGSESWALLRITMHFLTDAEESRLAAQADCSAAGITALMSAARHTIPTPLRAAVPHWNKDAEPFKWTATAASILDMVAMVAMLNRDYRKLVANNPK